MSDGTEDREAQVRLYELLAENKLNAGKVDEAEHLQEQAEELRREGPADSQLLIRVLLRTGRLDEARGRLEELVEEENYEPVQTPRAHRETQLLLSIIYAMQGRPEDAHQAAMEGTRRGKDLGSPFMIAVGQMRQGHALLLQNDPEQFLNARKQFEKAIQISQNIAIPRLKVEACWGLCQTYGRRGDLDEAATIAGEGIEIATQAGDEWIASLIRLSMGANHTLAEDHDTAAEWFGQALRGFQECSDPFGATVTRLWSCVGWYQQGNIHRLSQVLPEVLANCQQHGYNYFFTGPTLLGPFDQRILVPLLIMARDQGWQEAYARKLIQEIGLPGIYYHPGYQLRIETLGNFQVWRGDQLIPYNGWRRGKTRKLFQILITHRYSPLDRDQYCEHLWPGAEPEVAGRNFKVALNTLYNVLEPKRLAGSESAYILREGTIYGIRPGADIWIDTDFFRKTVLEAEEFLVNDIELAGGKLEKAMEFYQGEYLPDARYETWAATEREQLAVLFLQTADNYCDVCLQRDCFEEVIGLCQRILSMDNCWERAYRHLMVTYHRLGDHGQIARTYQRCIETLREELDVSPARETISLYEQLIS
jgi:DNA-binding SARP family transcriptional activator